MADKPIAVVTGVMGAIVLARATGAEQLSDDILASGRRTLRRRSTTASGAIKSYDRENRDHD
jgi:hypothetical protein